MKEITKKTRMGLNELRTEEELSAKPR